MAHEGRHFRNVMGRFTTGVAVVTARSASGVASGLTVNSLTSVSLDPPLLLVCLDVRSATLEAVRESGAFAVNLLGRESKDLAVRFARGRRATRFRGLDVRTEATGSPILEPALAWLDCRVDATHPGGDHAIVVGRVERSAARDGAPLLFFEGSFREDGV